MGGTCGTHVRGDKLYKVLVGKPKVKRPLGRPRPRMDLREVSWGCKVDPVGSG
jgi:hypothetical protein